MTGKHLFALFGLSLAVLLFAASFQSAAGYMDADYHLYMGDRIASGQGFSEELIWNYLDAPQILPHASHSYWPPLPSMLAALGPWTFPLADAFSAGRTATILLSAAISPLTALLAFQLTRRKGTALFAGLLAMVSIYYLPFLTTTDSFSPSMVLGLLFFLLIVRIEARKDSKTIPLSLGLTAGLLHLTRAEGLLWLLLAILAYSLPQWKKGIEINGLIFVAAGYFIIMLPWFVRNQVQFSSVLAPGALKTLWLSNYDELFSFPASQLNMANWLSSGWQAIVAARWWAIGQNLVTAFVVQGEIFLAPLIILGGWNLRRRHAVSLAGIAWTLLFIAMSLFFPFTGVRGGFFHAAAVLQPLIWVLAALGLELFVDWGVGTRSWNKQSALRVFRGAALLFGLVLSVFVFRQRVVGSELDNPNWNESFNHYQEIGEVIGNYSGSADYLVMVNNPPGFALAADRPAIVIPDGDLSASLAAAKTFGVDYLLLETDHPQGLDHIYERPEDAEGMELLTSFDGTHIFRVGAGD
jgi:hypothetical protein